LVGTNSLFSEETPWTILELQNILVINTNINALIVLINLFFTHIIISSP
jgi:hypothetical protein